MKRILTGIALLIGAGPLWAGSVDLSLSNETANLFVVLNRDPLFSQQARAQSGGAEVAIGGFINEIGDNIGHATLMARGVRQTLSSQYEISAGMKLIGGTVEVGADRENATDDATVGALALGFQAGLLLLPSSYNPVELSFEGFYAPNITSFSDAERYGEASARLQIEIMPSTRAYVGYRRMRFDTEDYENVRLDRGAHLGISISF